MQKGKLILATFSIVIAIIIGVLIGQHTQNDKQEIIPVITSYKVPAGKAGEISSAINEILWKAENQAAFGKAKSFQDGIVVVRAPRSFQEGVRKLITQMHYQKPTPQGTIKLDFWLVRGAPANKSTFKTPKALHEVLTSIDKIDGLRQYTVLEHISTSSVSGNSVSIKGAIMSARTTATINNGINLRFNLDSRLGDIRSKINLKEKEFVVLGQSAINTRRQNQVQGGNVYYIVRAEIIK